MNIINSTESFRPIIKMGNYTHTVPIGYTLKETTARGLDWVIVKNNGKDIVSISKRPLPIRSSKYRVYLHSYPNRKIQIENDVNIYNLFLSAPSNNIISDREVTKYIFGTDNLNDFAKLINLFLEH